ncbi:hypothetical protein BDV98DRAFT_597345 [Pterulicium gracile]|uniref:Hydrophobin n=1 Tax=Pterulicium gracile TaxID=1884261 RepID=A0A5C3Q6P1_9AGAR|nr:hypothetical protein BDV98DRAFT_597345 [Pterula gracilis]
MFFNTSLFAVSLVALAAATAVPRDILGSCTYVAAHQCCQGVMPAYTSLVLHLIVQFEAQVPQDPSTPCGINCKPPVGGVCPASQPLEVCCQNLIQGGALSIGCYPANA